jgi:hypothetical protein
MPGFDPKLLHVELMVEKKWHWGKFLGVLWFFPPILYTHMSFTYNGCYTYLATDSVIK